MKKTTDPSASVATVPCPQCGAPIAWTAAARWKPFCSERCKLLDFGAWANESYRIAAEPSNVSEIEDAFNEMENAIAHSAFTLRSRN